MTAEVNRAPYPFNDYVEPDAPPERTAGRWREAPAIGSKFQLVKWLPLPGKCASCGYSGGTNDLSADYERMFIDFGFDVDFYGVVGFCTDCVKEMGTVLGLVPPEEYQKVLTDLSAEISRSQELGLANDQLRGTIHTLTDVDRTPHFIVRQGSESESTVAESDSESEPTADELDSLKRRLNIPSSTGRSDNNGGLDI